MMLGYWSSFNWLTWLILIWVCAGFPALIAWNLFKDWTIRQSIRRRNGDRSYR